MSLIEHGTIEGGQIILAHPLSLPEGTEVVIHIETAYSEPKPEIAEEFFSLPFFGMWADREDMNDSADWVRKERAKWQQRISPQD